MTKTLCVPHLFALETDLPLEVHNPLVLSGYCERDRFVGENTCLTGSLRLVSHSGLGMADSFLSSYERKGHKCSAIFL